MTNGGGTTTTANQTAGGLLALIIIGVWLVGLSIIGLVAIAEAVL